jgi:hypothetical protein
VLATRRLELRAHAGRSFAIAVSTRRSPLPRDFHPEIPRQVSDDPKAIDSCSGGRSSFAGRLMTLLSRFLAFNAVLGHAARSRIPFDLASQCDCTTT